MGMAYRIEEAAAELVNGQLFHFFEELGDHFHFDFLSDRLTRNDGLEKMDVRAAGQVEQLLAGQVVQCFQNLRQSNRSQIKPQAYIHTHSRFQTINPSPTLWLALNPQMTLKVGPSPRFLTRKMKFCSVIQANSLSFSVIQANSLSR